MLAEIADPQGGNAKTRPCVIITDPFRQPFGRHRVVAISGSLTYPLPETHVLLPFASDGHQKTGLSKKCAAVCTWQDTITDEDVVKRKGTVPLREMEEILKIVKQIATSQ